jgi:hypothetical protein
MRKFAPMIVIALAILMWFAASPCRAWNGTGHELVAQIAYDTLSPATRSKIVDALKHHPRFQKDLMADLAPGEDPDRAAFIRAATWPDMIRSRMNPMSMKEHHPQWHYVDYPYDLDGVDGTSVVEQWDGKSDPANLIQAMQKVRKELADPTTAKDRVAIDLCWVEHLCGDIHQPLHAVSEFSREFPNGDRGGNSQSIANPGDIIKDVPTLNLHMFWDDIEGLSIDQAFIRQNADRIEKEHPADQMNNAIAVTDVAAWAKESLALAKEKVYLDGKLPHIVRDPSGQGPDEAPALPADYESNAKSLADERIALGGYRLAATLEEIAKGL